MQYIILYFIYYNILVVVVVVVTFVDLDIVVEVITSSSCSRNCYSIVHCLAVGVDVGKKKKLTTGIRHSQVTTTVWQISE